MKTRNENKTGIILMLIALIAFAIVACSGGGDDKTLTSITLNTTTVKASYTINDTLDLTGLTVTAVYSNGTTAAVTNYTASPANGFDLTEYGSVTITVSYTEDKVTQTAAFNVYVIQTTPGEIIGTGTSADPYHVHDVITLSSVGKTPEGYENWTLDAHYKQVKNIDLAEIENWIAIGYYTNSANYAYFTGSYDGGGYTIANLTIDATTAYQGLFGYVGTDGIVKNVGVIDCDITSTGGDVGGVVVVNYGTVSNCYVTGNVSGTQYIGGVVGVNSGTTSATVSNCYFIGNVSGTQHIGGVVGVNSGSGTVSNCYATGNVSGNLEVGGVVGLNLSGTVSNCYATSNVSGNLDVGGVVGNGNVGTTNTNTVSNIVALNSNITRTSGTSTYFGRVVGSSGSGTSTYARSTMTFIDGDSEPTTTFPTYEGDYPPDNGTDITSTQWSSSTWWTGTAGWDASIWDFSNLSATNLPTLRNVGGTQSPTVK